MDRARAALTFAPFVIVGALAVGLALAGAFAGPRVVNGPTRSVVPTPSTAGVSRTASPTVTDPADDAGAMLRVHNDLRAAIGAPAVRGDDRVNAAARRHAEYLARNAVGGHDETPGQAGFTGVSVRDRLDAQGYAGATASEVAISSGSGSEGVRSLWVLPYHRLGLMHPHAVVAGWGHAEIAGRTATVGVLVYDFASPSPDRVRSPAVGQRVPATWSGDESPDVLPAGAARPVGYPVMVVFSSARPVGLRSARLTDASSHEVAHEVVPQLYEGDYVAIVPSAPLRPGDRYRVRLELSVAGDTVVDEWEFEAER